MSKRNNEKLTCLIERFEGNLAVLSFDKGQSLKIPRKFVSKTAKLGDQLIVQFYSNSPESTDQRKLAKHILEEILNGS